MGHVRDRFMDKLDINANERGSHRETTSKSEINKLHLQHVRITEIHQNKSQWCCPIIYGHNDSTLKVSNEFHGRFGKVVSKQEVHVEEIF